MWQPGCEKPLATWFRVVFELFVSTRSKTATSASRTTLAFIHGQGDDGDEHHDDNDHEFTLSPWWYSVFLSNGSVELILDLWPPLQTSEPTAALRNICI